MKAEKRESIDTAEHEPLLCSKKMDEVALPAEMKSVKAVSDQKCLAVVAMNIFAVCEAGMMATYKFAAIDGFHVAEFTVLRNVSLFIVAVIWCARSNMDPLKMFPWD